MDGTQVIREGHMYRRYGNKDRSWSSWKKQWYLSITFSFPHSPHKDRTSRIAIFRGQERKGKSIFVIDISHFFQDKEKDWTHHPLKGCIIRRSGPFQGFPDSFSDWPAPPLDVCTFLTPAG